MTSLRLRAPAEHGQTLAVPPFEQVGPLLAENRQIISKPNLVQPDTSFAEVRSIARKETLACSDQYHNDAGEEVPVETKDIWILAGHQPELCHPGVWFKNFVLNHLAHSHGAMALNLIIDTDLVKPAILHVPDGARVARVPFDRSSLDAPYEECVVQDEALFADLPERVAPLTTTWGFEPMLNDFWPMVMHQARRTNLLGERFAAARRALERQFGVIQREVPMSRVCETPSFARFVAWIFGGLHAFHAIFNETVQEYRRSHRIHSRSHPVPDLASDGDWLETPFWAWRRDQRRRGKLFLRNHDGNWTLRIGADEVATIPAADRPALFQLMTETIKIRSRALTTTMFARLLLGDLFIHGIGGGVYDVLTDRILARFFGIPAPAYLTVSATLLLPLPRYPEAAQQIRGLKRRQRDLLYHPERFATLTAETAPWIDAKRRWLAHAGVDHAQRVERLRRLREANVQLRPFVKSLMNQAQRELAEWQQRLSLHNVAARRDYAFCLYPAEMLKGFYAETARKF